MTTPPFDHSTDRHPSDGVLLALHDNEREDMFDEARETELDLGHRHLDQCDECRARLAEIAAQSRRVRESLSFIPVPSVTAHDFHRRVAVANARRVATRYRRPAWQAAAAVLVVAAAAAAAATGPIRDWIRHRAESPAAAERAPAQSPATTPQAADRSGATVSFAAAGPEFTVRFDSVPETGALTVGGTTEADISARVVSGAGTGGDALVVLPGELRVRNSSRSRANYAVSVPSIVKRLRVIVAGQMVFDGTPRTVIQLRSQR
ncbi:MAG TPA: hypothetical protein VLN49_20530 [Gemmatimonadaceae bacterium]|nr:hypothetical protein [Gemmatimonadaceae bacterium]